MIGIAYWRALRALPDCEVGSAATRTWHTFVTFASGRRPAFGCKDCGFISYSVVISGSCFHFCYSISVYGLRFNSKNVEDW